MSQNRQNRETRRQIQQVVCQLLQCLRSTPGIGGGFLAVERAIEHLRHDRGGAFIEGTAVPQQRHHRRMLALASILAQDDAASPDQPHDASRREKMQARGDIGRFLPGRQATRFLPFPGVIEYLPLRDPIRADARTEGFHLDAQSIVR